MKILVVGSEGFIGKNIIAQLDGDDQFILVSCDVLPSNRENHFLVDHSTPFWDSLFTKFQFDFCINAAGAANVAASVLNPGNDKKLNVDLVSHLLESIQKLQPNCKLINFSSAAVYGNPKKLPINETDSLSPISPYGNHKLRAEKLCHKYFEQHGISSYNLRVFSAYGPHLRKQLFWDLYLKVQKGDVTLFGTGNESRDFIYIEDLVQVVSLIIKQNFQGANIINVASGNELTIKAAADSFLKSYGYTGELKFSGEQRSGDPINWQADISRLKKLGFQPRFNFEEGIQQYVNWLKSDIV